MAKRTKFFLKSFSFKRALLLAFILLFFIAFLLDFFLILFSQRFILNLRVAGINIGGLTMVQAKEKLTRREEETRELPQRLFFRFQDLEKTYEITAYDFNFQPRTDDSLKQAFQYGHRERVLSSLVESFFILFEGKDLPLNACFDTKQLESFIAELAKEIDLPEKDANLVFKGESVEISEAENGYRINQEKLKEIILYNFTHFKREPIELKRELKRPQITEISEGLIEAARKILASDLQLQIENKNFKLPKSQIAKMLTTKLVSGGLEIDFKDEEILGYLEGIAPKVDIQPKNVRLKLENGEIKILEEEKEGRMLNKEEAGELIKKHLLNRVSGFGEEVLRLSLKPVEPDVSTQTISKLNLKDLLGRATTSFAGSPQNRIHNIKVGASFLNGLLVAPGEEFSTLKSLGRIDNSSGYLPELVIKENKTVPEFGGGLCQVSTTLFRAILNAGLPVLERANHKYRVSYYEGGIGPGLDATIYEPKPDLRFKNDTPGHLLIQSYVEGTNLTFEIYGVSDGRSVKIEGPTILSTTPAPPPEYIDTETLPSGQLKQIERAHDGAKTIATYIVLRDGKEINRQVFKSTYIPWRARFLRGTAPAPAETPPPQP